MTAPVLDLAFAALSDPTRRDIVDRLTKAAVRVTDLAQPFEMSPHLFRRWFEPDRSIFRKAAVDELWYWEADHAGRLWAHYCRYLRVERPKLLEFTWMSEATRGLESRVSVELTPSRGGTDLTLTHSGLPDDEMRRGHEEGWKNITGVLAEKIKGVRKCARTGDAR